MPHLDRGVLDERVDDLALVGIADRKHLVVEGAGIATFKTDGSRFRSGGIIRLDNDWPTPATAGVIETAVREAGEDRYPPLRIFL